MARGGNSLQNRHKGYSNSSNIQPMTCRCSWETLRRHGDSVNANESFYFQVKETSSTQVVTTLLASIRPKVHLRRFSLAYWKQVGFGGSIGSPPAFEGVITGSTLLEIDGFFRVTHLKCTTHQTSVVHTTLLPTRQRSLSTRASRVSDRQRALAADTPTLNSPNNLT